jgi:transposase-like protein
LTLVENVPSASADSAPNMSVTKARGARRSKLSPDEEREIARLYADTSTSTSEICKRLGIGESSLYRIVQRQGLPLRGRSSAPKAAAAQAAPAPVAAPKRSAAAPAAKRMRSAPAPRTRQSRSSSADNAPVATPAPQAVAAGKRFRVRYQGERVFEAQNMQDALRQAESMGATEITGVSREDR